jgi:ribonucleotide reductase alpha subunit
VRLDAVAATQDGFELSRIDLEQRREGDVMGASQSGAKSKLRLLRVLRDEAMIESARDEATALIEQDPALSYESELAKGIYCGKDMDNLGDEWKVLKGDIRKFGIRNSQLLAIAPTSSTSLMMNATASILPVFQSFMIDSNNKGFNIVIPRFAYFKKYKVYKNMDINKVIDVVSKIQNFVDQGISYELLFDINDVNLTAGTILQSIINAWQKKLKALYYTRTVQKKNMYTKDKQNEISCESCAL